MKQIEIKALNRAISAIGFGSWAMGGSAWGAVDDAACMEAVTRALDQGITLYDTAPGYGAGHSEVLLGKALGAHRDEVAIATKFGFPIYPDGTVGSSNRPDSIRTEVEDSLRRLGTDRIDIYLMHWPNTETTMQEVAETLINLKAQGKVLSIGLCNVTVDLLSQALQVGHIDFVQVHHSMFIREIESHLLPFCHKNDITVMAYGVLAHGLLGGKMTHETKFGLDDWRSGKVFGTPNWRAEEDLFKPGLFEENLAKVEKLKVLATKLGCSVAALATAWVLREGGSDIALCGAKRPSQVDDWAKALDISLDAEILADIEGII